MYRRMSLGFLLLLLLVIFVGVGAAPASAGSLAEPKAATVDSFDLLDRAWDWLTSLVGDSGETSRPGGERIEQIEGGVFIDPLGGNG
jgi:hypothetical protein